MLVVLQVTPRLDAGGVERTTIEVAQAVQRAGGRALVASEGGRLEGELAAVGGALVTLPMATKNPIAIWRNSGALAQLAARERVTLIHARSRAPAWSALWAARRLKLPFVTTYHGIYNARSPWKRLYNSVMARGDIVIANSEYTRQHVLNFHRVPESKVIAIPRGVDLALFDPRATAPARVDAVRKAWGLDVDPSVVTFLLPARLTRWKGATVAIAALKRLNAERPNAARLVLAGDAQGRLDYAAELEVAARGQDVRIVGHVRDMPAAFLACDAALFPSLEPEAFGRGAIEAQAMGLPVIASRAGGFTETIVEGETGLLVPPGDVAALAAAMTRIAALHPEGRAAMGKRGMERARGLYGIERLQAATLAAYDRLVGGRGE
ncbi:MAG: glycosyltransferase family 4 protein [Hyphomonadaceae bacterium]|nr:glycosyltransferase family 4 protein [Hyphomonadaceae bacterium]